MKTKEQIRDALRLDQLPDDEFMQLLAEAGDDPVVRGPHVTAEAYTPDQIVGEFTSAIIATTVGSLLSQAREATELSLREVAKRAGVTHARIQQLESSENIETATLLRVAEAMGYHVRLTLVPEREGLKPLSADLHAMIT